MQRLHRLRVDRVQFVSFSQSSLRDADLTHLKGLTRLSRLNLGYTQVSDAGLADLIGMTKLQVLILDGTKMTDAGLGQLRGIVGLSHLGALPHSGHRRWACTPEGDDQTLES